MNHWGYHLVLDCSDCESGSIRNESNIYNFVKQLVKDIDMVAYGEPQIVHFGHSGKKGYTLIQLIETSNICAHFVEENNSMYLDVFSCKPFNQDVVVEVVNDFFKPVSIRKTYLTRQA